MISLKALTRSLATEERVVCGKITRQETVLAELMTDIFTVKGCTALRLKVSAH